MILNKKTIALSTFVLMVGTDALAQGALDFADPCKKAETNFHSTRSAIESARSAAMNRLAGWRADPETLPKEVLDQYRGAVRAFAYSTWLNSPIGKATIESWGDISEEEKSAKFFQHIYPTSISEDDEVELAQNLFERDYDERIKPEIEKEFAEQDVRIAAQKEELDANCSPDVFNRVVRSTIGRATMIVSGNFEAAKNENGDVAAAIRVLSGISITDIMKYGIAGGENSELNKIRDAWNDTLNRVGIDENHALREFLRGIDVTNIDTPSQVETTVDNKTLENATTNLSGGLVKDGKINLPKIEIPTPKIDLPGL